MPETLNLSPIPLTRFAIETGGLRVSGVGISEDFTAAVEHLLAEGWLRWNPETKRAEALREGRHQVAVSDVLAAVERAVKISGSDWSDILGDVEAILLAEEGAD